VFLAGSSDRWTWSMDVERFVDFCVYALRRDGLRVTPFDQHPDGDGSLRVRGLDTKTWRTWLASVLDAHGRLRALSTADLSQVDRQQIKGAFDAFSAPASLCQGSTELRARLEALWVEYEPTGQQWEDSLTGGQAGPMSQFLTRRPARQIWKGLLPYHERLATLQVYLVDYPAPAVLTVPPLTCIIAPAAGDGDGFAGQVVSAAEMLAAS